MSYYISPRFLDKLAIHITKNFLDLPQVRVPLILGIHGRKGEGKSFQCELVFQRMGIEVLHISGGELESPDAGDPARLIRLRYREAAELIRTRGRMAALLINDLDAGAGRFDQGTQYTVNTQLVNATLMNIADNPTNVQLPGSYDDTPLPRVPILITGNDLSTLYAPLIRDGRMEKFYWEPDRPDKIGIVSGIFSPDGLSPREIEQLVDQFPNQAIDFYGALRSRIYDEQVRQFIHQIGFEKISQRVVNSVEGKPTFPKPDFSLARLIEQGNAMVAEQHRVDSMRLVREYNQVLQDHPFAVRANPTPTPQPTAPISPPPTTHPKVAATDGNGHSAAAPARDFSANGHLSPEILEQLNQITTQDYRVGIEYADQRRFRINSWQSYALVPECQTQEAIATLERCLSEHPDDYIRLVGIAPQAKRRAMETVIQRPGNR